jgi:hypothetical protein
VPCAIELRGVNAQCPRTRGKRAERNRGRCVIAGGGGVAFRYCASKQELFTTPPTLVVETPLSSLVSPNDDHSSRKPEAIYPDTSASRVIPSSSSSSSWSRTRPPLPARRGPPPSAATLRGASRAWMNLRQTMTSTCHASTTRRSVTGRSISG